MQHRKKTIVSAIAGLGMGALCLSPLHAKTWTDVSGKHTLEADFVALKEGKITLKTTGGKVTTFPFKNLCKADRSHAMNIALGNVSEDDVAGDVVAEAKVQLSEVVLTKNGERSSSYRLNVEVDLTGGPAAEAYAIGKAEFDPVVVNGKELKPGFGIHIGEYSAIKRHEDDFFSEHPDDGVRLKTTLKNAPEDLDRINVLKGTVTVLAGGKVEFVKLDNLLERPTAVIVDPVLAEAGIELTFTRAPQGDSSDIGVSMTSDTKGFAGLKLVGPDGKSVPDAGSGHGTGGGTVEHSVYATNDQLKDATLHIILRDGKEVELPFELKDVEVGN